MTKDRSGCNSTQLDVASRVYSISHVYHCHLLRRNRNTVHGLYWLRLRLDRISVGDLGLRLECRNDRSKFLEPYDQFTVTY